MAGSEAAWQIARAGVDVTLYEMRPELNTPAHQTADFAELVCSNSLGSDGENTAGGLLKRELESFDSLILKTARRTSVPAGGALAVDRRLFAQEITEFLSAHPRIRVLREECAALPTGIAVIATGPLTSAGMVASLQKLTGEEQLYFYDAAAPIISGESVDYARGFWGARYGRGSADYFNCPLTKAEYELFWSSLVQAEVAPVHDLEAGVTVFEGCIPLEILAKRGEDALRYGPFRPVGLTDQKGERPYAVLQLRKENTEASLFNLVGCQTRLKWGEQRRVFQLIPALSRCEFVRYGVMHRNTYINSPKNLTASFQFCSRPEVFLAGQITGVEGYLESTAAGLLAGINAVRLLRGAATLVLPRQTMLGGLAHYISSADQRHFQPMNANFGILPPLEQFRGGKKERRAAYVHRAVQALADYLRSLEGGLFHA